MTGQEFLEKYNREGKLTIKFTKEIDDTNSQWEENMMADVTNVYNENGTIVIAIDSSNYIDFNKTCQKPIWFNNLTGKNDATRDEFLSQEEDNEDYDDEFYVKSDNIINIFSIV